LKYLSSKRKTNQSRFSK